MKPLKKKFLQAYPYVSPRTGLTVFEAVKYQAWFKDQADPGKVFAYRFQCDPRCKCEGCGGVYYHYGKPDGANGMLYRVPSGNYAFWCEGEKDADAVGKEGTSHHGGAGKANIVQASRLVDVSRVLIVMDLDHDGKTPLHGPGAWCAWRRYQLMKEVGNTPYAIVAPREGKDAHDHITGGFSLGQFRKVDPTHLAKVARESRPRRKSRKWRAYAG